MTFVSNNNQKILLYGLFISGLWILAGRMKVALKIGLFYVVVVTIDMLLGKMVQHEGVTVIRNILFFVLRMPVFYFMAMWFMEKIRLGELIGVLNKFNIPKGLIVGIAVIFRFIPTVTHEIQSVNQTMGQRGLGIGIKNIIFHPIRTVEYAMVPLVIRSITISEELSVAAMSKGMELKGTRTSAFDIAFKKSDAGILLLTVVYLVLVHFI
jgi:energy-coupling factor transport system permease protein